MLIKVMTDIFAIFWPAIIPSWTKLVGGDSELLPPVFLFDGLVNTLFTLEDL
jgi:hypothetical protein